MTSIINMEVRTDNETVVNQCISVVEEMRKRNAGHITFSADFGDSVIIPEKEYDLLNMMALKERKKNLDRLKEESPETHSSKTAMPSPERLPQP